MNRPSAHRSSSLVAAEQALRDYVRAFAALDAARVAEFYYSPCLFLAPWGETVAATPELAQQIAAQLIEQAQSQGYARTEIVDLRGEQLAANLCSLQGCSFAATTPAMKSTASASATRCA